MKIGIYLVALISPFVLCYLAGGFISMKWDVTLWEEQSRVSYVVLSGLVAYVALFLIRVIFSDMED